MPARSLLATLAACALLACAANTALAQEDFSSWPVLVNPFESTGGGGIMIDGYKPVVVGDKCTTDFTATTPAPDKKVYANTIEFEAVSVQGGILCQNGKWRAKDGRANGTTPFRVFIKDGVVRRSP